MKKKNMNLKVKISISCILGITLVAIFILGITPPAEDKIHVGGVNYRFSSTYLSKFISLAERERYYKGWIEKIILKDVDVNASDEYKVNKIFDWIKDHPDFTKAIEVNNKVFDWIKDHPDFIKNYPDFVEISKLVEANKKFPKFKLINQHAYHVLIKQYGMLYERVENFCNLIAIAGYQASEIYEGSGKVIVRIPKEDKFLYFDLTTGEDFVEPEAKKQVFREKEHEDKCKDELRKLDNGFKKFKARKYLWADLNVARYAFWYYFENMFCEPERKEYLIKN